MLALVAIADTGVSGAVRVYPSKVVIVRNDNAILRKSASKLTVVI